MQRTILTALDGGDYDMLFHGARRIVLSVAAIAVVIGALLAASPAQLGGTIRYVVAALAAIAAISVAAAVGAGTAGASSRENEALYRSIIQLSRDGICVVDDQGRFTFVNPRFAAMLQYPAADLLGRRLRDFVDPREHEAFDARFEDRRRGSEHAQNDVTLVRADGKLVPVLSTTTTCFENGRMVAVIGMLTDREAEVRREIDMAAHLATANDAVQTFTYSVSHDLRAPLRAIDGFARELQLDPDTKLGTRGAAHLERIRTAATRMRVTVDSLLDLSSASRRPLHREKVDLSAIARAAVAELDVSSRSVTFDITPRLFATGDPHLLRIVLDNLLANAVKFTSKNAAAHIAFGCLNTADGATYFVRDDGAGFDPKDATELFVPFQRLHSSTEFDGSGIGLATVQRVVQRHGGRVWAEGSPGRGATFFFTLGDPPHASSRH
jgi:PAS domain S-box-containing protein